MSGSRSADIKIAGHLYVFEAPFGETICTYCGECATVLDHVMPISAAAALHDVIVSDRPRFRHGLKIVPCCADCNTRLGHRVFTCISAKREALAKLLYKRHKRLLGTYDWQEVELASMGRMLHTYIEARDSRRRVVEDRIRFARNNGRVQ